ncbi:MAG TPA: hypothetical protein EYP10_09080 [Armatimonadetes bacterium]|nr:hypothetical protein [Armatimonadota bacterium]
MPECNHKYEPVKVKVEMNGVGEILGSSLKIVKQPAKQKERLMMRSNSRRIEFEDYQLTSKESRKASRSWLEANFQPESKIRRVVAI